MEKDFSSIEHKEKSDKWTSIQVQIMAITRI